MHSSCKKPCTSPAGSPVTDVRRKVWLSLGPSTLWWLRAAGVKGRRRVVEGARAPGSFKNRITGRGNATHVNCDRLQVYASCFTPLQSSRLLSCRPPLSNGPAPPLPHLSCAPVQTLLPIPGNLLFLLDLSPAHNFLLSALLCSVHLSTGWRGSAFPEDLC